jgi:hypothetical protein
VTIIEYQTIFVIENSFKIRKLNILGKVRPGFGVLGNCSTSKILWWQFLKF